MLRLRVGGASSEIRHPFWGWSNFYCRLPFPLTAREVSDLGYHHLSKLPAADHVLSVFLRETRSVYWHISSAKEPLSLELDQCKETSCSAWVLDDIIINIGVEGAPDCLYSVYYRHYIDTWSSIHP